VLAQPVEHPARGNAVTFATTTATLALAAVSGGFSISGMTAVFIGVFWPVVCMGAAIEFGIYGSTTVEVQATTIETAFVDLQRNCLG
jgi:hypothetical protein